MRAPAKHVRSMRCGNDGHLSPFLASCSDFASPSSSHSHRAALVGPLPNLPMQDAGQLTLNTIPGSTYVLRYPRLPFAGYPSHNQVLHTVGPLAHMCLSNAGRMTLAGTERNSLVSLLARYNQALCLRRPRPSMSGVRTPTTRLHRSTSSCASWASYCQPFAARPRCMLPPPFYVCTRLSKDVYLRTCPPSQDRCNPLRSHTSWSRSSVSTSSSDIPIKAASTAIRQPLKSSTTIKAPL